MKILTIKQLKSSVIDGRGNKKIVFMSGVFDLFHFGHFRALKNAASFGDVLIVQIDGDKLVRKRKGVNRPYIGQQKRAIMVSSLEFVDYVFVSNRPSEGKDTLSVIRPDIYIRAKLPSDTGTDRKRREKLIKHMSPESRVVWLEQFNEISTTRIASLLNNKLRFSFSFPKIRKYALR